MTQLGKYELHEQLGRGGFGTVYRATDTSLDREVAIKILHPQLMVDDTFVERFKKEARILATFEHPNIVSIYDFDEIDGRVFIVMRYLSNGSLQKKLKDNGPFSFEQCVSILSQVCNGLQVAHNLGFIHRDIKPANILFDTEDHAILSDFGLARVVGLSSVSSIPDIAGTPAYRAPELWRANTTSPATDIYSLGCILSEMLTGKVLFDGKTIDAILMQQLIDGPQFPEKSLQKVPDEIFLVLKKALEKDPLLRQVCAEAFANDLLKCQKTNITNNKGLFLGIETTKIKDVGYIPEYEISSRTQILKNSISLIKISLTSDVEIEFARIPPGEFLMGSSDLDEKAYDNEKPQHQVFLDEYWIGKYPVTNQQYQVYVKATTAQPPEDWDGSLLLEGKASHPVVNVSWQDARGFCEWLKDISGKNVRLPSEAEWEKAARGTRGRIYPWGNQWPDERRCNFSGNVFGTSSVGKYSPGGDSPYDIVDMSGNVWEWVEDWYGENYYMESPSSNPKGPDEGKFKLTRGGGWDQEKHKMRSALRSWSSISYTVGSLGFRCVLSLQ